MSIGKTHYYYVMHKITSDKCTIEIEVKQLDKVLKTEIEVSFEHNMPSKYKAAGLLVAIKELQEIAILNFDIINNNISLDNLF